MEEKEEKVDTESLNPSIPTAVPTLYGISVSTLLVCFLILPSTTLRGVFFFFQQIFIEFLLCDWR